MLLENSIAFLDQEDDVKSVAIAHVSILFCGDIYRIHCVKKFTFIHLKDRERKTLEYTNLDFTKDETVK